MSVHTGHIHPALNDMGSAHFWGKNMRTILCPVVLSGLLATTTLGAPLLPEIADHSWLFGAYNKGVSPTIEYQTNGAAPDILIFTAGTSDSEVTTYWPQGPQGPAYPVWSLAGMPFFGGDMVLEVAFSAEDSATSPFAVSLLGAGANPAGVADLEIYGTLVVGLTTYTGLLWAVDLEAVVLYGNPGSNSYILEGVGTVLSTPLAVDMQVVGQPGAMRGHLDFVNPPAGWMPANYSPTSPVQVAVRADYDGETGLIIPEPATTMLLVGGLPLLALRRRR